MTISAATSRPVRMNDAIARELDAIVIGGGVSGLSTAAWMARAGLRAAVVEQSPVPGGVMSTLARDGFLFERGPNTVLDKYPSFDTLVEWAGLGETALRVPMKDTARHIYKDGRLHTAPTGLIAGATSGLLPLSGKLALLREPFIKPMTDREESLADFVRRRLGKAWLDNLITPMVSGIWAGDPEKLCVDQIFPVMKEMEREGGSLIHGAMKRMKRLKAEREARGEAKREQHMVSFPEGLGQLSRALGTKLGRAFVGGAQVEGIEPPAHDGEPWRVMIGLNGESALLEAPRLVVTGDAARSAGLVEPFDTELAATLRAIRYNRLCVVSLGLERASLERWPGGFGFLVPREQDIRILGAITVSNIFAGRAPEGCVALAVFVGGELDPAAMDLADDEMLGLVRRDLRKALGWNGEARVEHVERWERALPQYEMRHGAQMAQIAEAEARHPGLHLAGNWRGGPSVVDRIEQTRLLVERKISNAPARA